MPRDDGDDAYAYLANRVVVYKKGQRFRHKKTKRIAVLVSDCERDGRDDRWQPSVHYRYVKPARGAKSISTKMIALDRFIKQFDSVKEKR